MIFDKLRSWYKKLPANKKHYIELASAFLSIPVLLTVLLINISNLSKNNQPAQTPIQNTPTPIEKIIEKPIIITQPISTNEPQSATPTANQCIKKVGSVEIAYPLENQTVSDNPLQIIIQQNSDQYCDVVWSYKINNGSWSDFTDKSISIYNLDSGQKTLTVQVKSVVSSDSTVLTRNFTYQNQSITTTTTISPTPTATSSATTK